MNITYFDLINLLDEDKNGSIDNMLTERGIECLTELWSTLDNDTLSSLETYLGVTLPR